MALTPNPFLPILGEGGSFVPSPNVGDPPRNASGILYAFVLAPTPVFLPEAALNSDSLIPARTATADSFSIRTVGSVLSMPDIGRERLGGAKEPEADSELPRPFPIRRPVEPKCQIDRITEFQPQIERIRDAPVCRLQITLATQDGR